MFKGKWTYRSLKVDPKKILEDAKKQDAEEWAPVGDLVVVSNESGKITAQLVLRNPQAPPLLVTGQISKTNGVTTFRASAVVPKDVAEKLEAKAKKAGLAKELQAVKYELSGFGVPLDPRNASSGKMAIRGAVLASGEDLGKELLGTVGYFVLEPQ